MSSSRKIIRLAKCIYSWPAILDSRPTLQPIGLANFINNWIGNFNDILDDIAYLGGFGFFSKSLTRFAEVWADRVWFSSCFFDIFVLVVQLHYLQKEIAVVQSAKYDSGEGSIRVNEIRKLNTKRAMCCIGLLKMFGDVGIASTYACHLNTSKGNIALFGLLSASAGIYKLYAKAKQT
eukprot:CRZ01252.1 hypothetical protein [Spongospora subterranea]